MFLQSKNEIGGPPNFKVTPFKAGTAECLIPFTSTTVDWEQ